MSRLWSVVAVGLVAVSLTVVNAGEASAASTGDTHGLVDSSNGRWHLYDGAVETFTFYFGNPGDYPFMGDWDCDGVDSPGLYRQSDGYVYLRNSNSQGIADVSFFFGDPGDVPLAGDFNADGCDTVSIYRPSEQRFFIINELGTSDGGLGAADYSFLFGNQGDKPFVGDFNGNGQDTVGLHRETTGLVYFRNTTTTGNADNQFIFGDPGDRLVAGDWNNNGIDSPGLFRPSNTTMYLRYANSQGSADESWVGGDDSWLPVAGDFEPPWKALADLDPLFKKNYGDSSTYSVVGISYPGSAWLVVNGGVQSGEVEFDLSKDWGTLAGTLGYGDNGPDTGQMYVVFYVDGVEVYNTILTLGSEISDFELPVKDALRLRITASYISGRGQWVERAVFGNFKLYPVGMDVPSPTPKPIVPGITTKLATVDPLYTKNYGVSNQYSTGGTLFPESGYLAVKSCISEAEVQFDLGKQWSTLDGALGYEDGGPAAGQMQVSFLVDGVTRDTRMLGLGDVDPGFSISVKDGLRLQVVASHITGGDCGSGILRSVFGAFSLDN